MIRNLKVLLAAAMAVGVLGALSASGAQAAEFHCSVEPCRVTVKPDGTGKTAHQVITIKVGSQTFSTTCNTITGEGTSSTKTFKELTLTNIVGAECSIQGEAANLTMNGCHYLMKVTGASTGSLTIICPAGKQIEAGTNGGSGCIYNIPAQGPLNGFKFHNNEAKTEITVETSITGMAVTINNKCYGIKEGPAEAEFTTGNTILTSETDPGGVMASLWWE